MNISIDLIDPNPHRDLINYPPSREAIDEKKALIEKTHLWPTVVARHHPTKKGRFQLIFGHTRLAAAKELGMKEINLTIDDVDEDDMVLMLADENKDSDLPARTNESVSVIRLYLKEIFDNCNSFEELPPKIKEALINVNAYNTSNKGALDKKHLNSLSNKELANLHNKFGNIKAKGIGVRVIYSFLNSSKPKETWSESKISEALSFFYASEGKRNPKTNEMIEEPYIDIKAAEKFSSNEQAVAFRQAVKTYKIPIKDQKKVADKIIKERKNPRDGSAKEVKEAVQKVVIEKKKSTALTKTDKNKIERDAELDELKELIEETAKSVNSANSKITILLSKLNEMKVSTLSGLEITENDIYCGILVDTLIEFSPYLSFSISKENK
jgi:hypothetical protein